MSPINGLSKLPEKKPRKTRKDKGLHKGKPAEEVTNV